MEKREKPPSLTECVEFDDMAGREEEKNGGDSILRNPRQFMNGMAIR